MALEETAPAAARWALQGLPVRTVHWVDLAPPAAQSAPVSTVYATPDPPVMVDAPVSLDTKVPPVNKSYLLVQLSAVSRTLAVWKKL